MDRIELLAPAGDLNKLKTAIDYGADAVFLGGESFGLRTASKNFSLDQIREGVDYAHERGKKVHVTLNIIPHDKDFADFDTYLIDLEKTGIDAVIVSDPGVFMKVKELTEIPIHMSTQGSLANSDTVNFWAKLGAERAVLARELNLEEIKGIIQEVGNDIEIETFVHGAMCMSYSGRCLISNYMTGRDANLGDCAQPCRYKYHLVEETRPGEYYPVMEDENGTFIMNSKDLCMIAHIDDLIEAGISSLKIEGRVKSDYYVASIVRAYRMAIDRYYENPGTYSYDSTLLDEIRKVSHRDFTTGFYYDEAKMDGIYGEKTYIRLYDYVGRVISYNKDTKIVTINQKNRVFPGEVVEVFGPNRPYREITLGTLYDEEGEEIESANRADMIYKTRMDEEVFPGDMIRRKVPGVEE